MSGEFPDFDGASLPQVGGGEKLSIGGKAQARFDFVARGKTHDKPAGLDVPEADRRVDEGGDACAVGADFDVLDGGGFFGIRIFFVDRITAEDVSGRGVHLVEPAEAVSDKEGFIVL